MADFYAARAGTNAGAPLDGFLTAVHTDYLAGKFPSALKAFEAAGLKKHRSRLQELKNAWQKATIAE